MKNKNRNEIIAITSDLHVAGQFEKGINSLLNEVGRNKSLKHVDLYIAGDMTPFTKDGWNEDLGYQAKKRVRKETGNEELARKAQKEAWQLYKSEMIDYGLRTQKLSVELIDSISDLVNRNVINPIQKVIGNSTKIISDDQRKALDLSNRGDEPTMEDLIKGHSSQINVYTNVNVTRYGDAVVLSIPYSENAEDQNRYFQTLKRLEKQDSVKEVFVVYHENRLPELVGIEGKPVNMKCLSEMVDIVKGKYSGATIYEVVGHNHIIPKGDFRIETPDNTLMVPVGIDSKSLLGAILVIGKEKIKRLEYQVI